MVPPFHLAFPVDDLAAARVFYGDLLGCIEGRSSETWVDFDLHGHQIVAHLVTRAARGAPDKMDGSGENAVDGHGVPVPHFGLVLPWEEWEALAARFREHGLSFVIEPYVRFAGEVGEQGTYFVRDPAGNALEFKTFRDPSRLFAV